MSLNSTCFWLFTPVQSQYFREEVFLSRKCDTAQKADIINFCIALIIISSIIAGNFYEPPFSSISR